RRGDGEQDLELRVPNVLGRHVVPADARVERVEADVAARAQVERLDADRAAESVVLALRIEEPALAAEDELTQAVRLQSRALPGANLAEDDDPWVRHHAGRVPLPAVHEEAAAGVRVAAHQ